MSRTDSDYLAPKVIALAHRGGALLPANLGIENTAAAFRNAVELGFRYLETDVHASRDGALFAFHDADLTRVADRPERISQLTRSELAEVLIGGREPIPLLAELLEEFPDCRFNIDLKADGAVDGLAATLRAHRAQRRVCVGSFSGARIRRFRRLMPDVTTAAPPSAVALLAAGLVRRSPGGAAPSVFQVPLRQRVGPVRVPLVTPRLVRALHDAGRKLHVWTIDSPDVMHLLLDWGVDGIVTDRPDLLKAVLLDRGMWSTRDGT